MSFLSILILSGALALACFIVGNLPLSFNFSKLRIAQLSTLGVGLLLGAALGIIIPEGVEAIFTAATPSSHPSQITAYTLLAGFILMLFVEQVLLPSHDHSGNEYSLVSNNEAGRSSSNLHARVDSNGNNAALIEDSHRKARSITFGLVVHSLADGLALGASSFSTSVQGDGHSHSRRILDTHSHSHSQTEPGISGGISDQLQSNHLTFIVFLALLIHKLPTALALSTTLLQLIPTRRIRLHIGIFALATPLGALLSFILLGLFDSNVLGSDGGENTGKLWAGIALTFSGGTFLYVATVLQPVRDEPPPTSGNEVNGSGRAAHGQMHPGEGEVQQLGPKMRVGIICLGMIMPLGVAALIGHGH